jgi:hypothetical protein
MQLSYPVGFLKHHHPCVVALLEPEGHVDASRSGPHNADPVLGGEEEGSGEVEGPGARGRVSWARAAHAGARGPAAPAARGPGRPGPLGPGPPREAAAAAAVAWQLHTLPTVNPAWA